MMTPIERSILDALASRVSKGADYLAKREFDQDTGGSYRNHFEVWESLLAQYQAQLTGFGVTR